MRFGNSATSSPAIAATVQSLLQACRDATDFAVPFEIAGAMPYDDADFTAARTQALALGRSKVKEALGGSKTSGARLRVLAEAAKYLRDCGETREALETLTAIDSAALQDPSVSANAVSDIATVAISCHRALETGAAEAYAASIVRTVGEERLSGAFHLGVGLAQLYAGAKNAARSSFEAALEKATDRITRAEASYWLGLEDLAKGRVATAVPLLSACFELTSGSQKRETALNLHVCACNALARCGIEHSPNNRFVTEEVLMRYKDTFDLDESRFL